METNYIEILAIIMSIGAILISFYTRFNINNNDRTIAFLLKKHEEQLDTEIKRINETDKLVLKEPKLKELLEYDIEQLIRWLVLLEQRYKMGELKECDDLMGYANYKIEKIVTHLELNESEKYYIKQLTSNQINKIQN